MKKVIKRPKIPKAFFEKKGIRTFGFVSSITVTYNYITKILDYNSLILEEYFQEVSTPHTKNNFKNISKVFIAYHCTLLLFNAYVAFGDIVATSFHLFCLIANMIFYLSILFLHCWKEIERLNMIVLSIIFISLLIGMTSCVGLLETNFTPTFQLALLMFSNSPLKVNNALLLWLASYSLIILGVIFSYGYKKHIKSAVSTLFNDSLLSGLQVIPFYDNETNISVTIMSFMILGLALTLLFVYLLIANSFYRRSSFTKLSGNIEAKLQLKAAMKVQSHWIDTIMPKVIKDEYLEHNDDIKMGRWVYVKTFDNVSILFADIVGFTKMSSNKSASHIVALLNDLFNRFDELCICTNCEKLGTLGDCYYCVAGCPLSRPDHAISCIEMGLGMCHIIQKFNHDYNEDVEMRVGIHTGRVNAAILGKQRFRFDVYSNDVLIASRMESTGQPGRVHISEAVYEYIRHAYTVEKGSDLEIKREEGYGIAGMLLKTTLIKTYFIDPQSSHIHMKDGLFQKGESLKLLSINSKKVSSFIIDSTTQVAPLVTEKTPKTEETDHSEYENKIKGDISLIDNLRLDPNKEIELLKYPPMKPFSLTFLDKEINWHFNCASLHKLKKFSTNWMKFAPFIDGWACFSYSLALYIVVFILFNDTITRQGKVIILLSNLLSILIIILMTYQCHDSQHHSTYSFHNLLYVLFSNHFIRFLMCLYFITMPLCIIMGILYDCTKLFIDSSFTIRYFTLIFFALYTAPLFMSAHYYLKILICLINTIIVIFVLSRDQCAKRELLYTFPHYSCFGQLNITEVVYTDIVRNHFYFQIVATFIVLLLIIREIEVNIRIMFLVTRENKINYEEAYRAMINTQQLLYNIIPKYVFNQLKTQKGNEKEITNFNYAVSVPRAAVIFACISNFFSKYYREDYKGGENALKLLHKIICLFDDVIQKEMYRDVEKIKTVNDCYMVASGLNSKKTKKVSRNDHLNALMYYAFDIMKSLDFFNENYIIGTEKFEMKIGYNFGPVTAGIIGATKPMYDIWGDTVNISSRMYSTGIPGSIQVPDYVKEELKTEFSFTYRGKILVKGKGTMDTYICSGPAVSELAKRLSPSGTLQRKSTLLNRHIIHKLLKKNLDISKPKLQHRNSLMFPEIEKKGISPRGRAPSFIQRPPARLSEKNVFVGFTFQ